MLALGARQKMSEEFSPFQESYESYTMRTPHLQSPDRLRKPNERNLEPEVEPERQKYNAQRADQHSSEEETFNPRQCLFCNTETTSLDSNLEHMALAHSFFVPDTEFLIDVESFLSYLFAIISRFHECLLCGSLKTTRFAVQDHMRGKGHCKIDLEDDEHQFGEFYDFSTGSSDETERLKEEVVLDLNDEELCLPSGKILGHRSHVNRSRRHVVERSKSSSSSQLQLTSEVDSEPLPTESVDTRIVPRAGTSTSLVGVPELQRRALIAVEKHTLRMEMTARNEYQSHVEKGGNKQKTYRAAGIGKKQGGLEKRLG